MATRTALLLLLVFGCSESSSFTPKHQYEYRYEGEQRSGQSKGEDWVSARLRCNVTIQAATTNIVYVKLSDIDYSDFHGRRGQDVGQQLPDTSQTTTEFRQDMERPFKLHLTDGIVQRLTRAGDEPVAVTNIKKSIVQLLQVNLNERRAVGEPRHRLNPLMNTASGRWSRPRQARVMEYGISGDCETIYEVMPHPSSTQQKLVLQQLRQRYVKNEDVSIKMPIHPFMVHKTKNFENCHKLSLWHHNGVEKSSSSINDFHSKTVGNTKRSSYTQYLLDGDTHDFTINEVFSRSSVVMNPYKENSFKLWTFSEQTLILTKSHGMKKFFGSPRNPVIEKNIMFRYPTVDGNQLNMPDLISAPQIPAGFPGVPKVMMTLQESSQMMDKVLQILNRLDRVFAQNVHTKHDKEVALSVIEAEETMSRLSYNQLKQLQRLIPTPTQTEMYLDLLSITGSNPAVLLLIDQIEHKQMSEQQTANVISSFPMHVKTPTPQLIQQLMQLRKSSQIQEHEHLRTTLALSLGNIFHKLCADNNDKMSMLYPQGNRCQTETLSLMTQFVEQLIQEVERRSELEKLAYLQAMGNVGHDIILPYLQSLVSERNSDLITSKAIYSLYKLGVHKPQQVRIIVSPIVHDTTRKPEVRQAAITVLLATDPPSAYWQNMAMSTWRETSEQMISFIHSSIQSYAEDTNRSDRRKKAEVSLSMVRRPQNGWAFSKKQDISSLLSKVYPETQGRMSYIVDSESSVPKTMYLKLNKLFKNMINGNAKMVVNMEGVKTIFDDMVKLMSGTRGSSVEQELLSDKMRSVLEQLGMANQETYYKTPKFSVYTSWMGSMDQFMQMDARKYDILKSLLTSRTSIISQPTQKIMYLNDKTIVVPSEMGLPVVCTKKTPLIVSMRGQIETKWDIKRGKLTVVGKDVKPFLSVHSRQQISFVNPMSHKFLGSAVEKNVQMQFPLNFQIQVNLNSQTLETVIEPLTREVEATDLMRLVHTYSTPVTFAIQNRYEHPLIQWPTAARTNYRQDAASRGEVSSFFWLPVGRHETTTIEHASQWRKLGNAWNSIAKTIHSTHPVLHHADLCMKPTSLNLKKVETTIVLVSDSTKTTNSENSIIVNPKHQELVSKAARQIKQMKTATGTNGRLDGVALTCTIIQRNLQQKNFSAQLALEQDKPKKSVKLNVQTPEKTICATIQGIHATGRSTFESLRYHISGKLGVGRKRCEENEATINGSVVPAEYFLNKCFSQQEDNLDKCQDAFPTLVKEITLRFDMTKVQYNKHQLSSMIEETIHSLLSKYSDDIETERSESNTTTDDVVELRASLKPKQNNLDLVMSTSYQTRWFRHIPLPFARATMHPLLFFYSGPEDKLNDLAYSFTNNYCSVEKPHLRTFDGVRVPLPEQQACATVLAVCKSCARPVVVTMKDRAGSRDVSLLFDDEEITLKTDDSGVTSMWRNERRLAVEVGGRQEIRRPDQTSPSAVLLRHDERLFEVQLPLHHVSLKLIDQNLSLRMSPRVYRGQLRGACGDIDGERTAELVDAQDCVHTTSDAFLSAFRVTMPSSPSSENSDDVCRPYRLPHSLCQLKSRLYSGFR